jgi:hypothetical protein
MFDDEKLYWEILMPSRDDMDTLKWFELNPPAFLGAETRICCPKHQLVLKVRYYDDDISEHDLAVPFPILKRDVPLELARFIGDKVVEDRRGGHYNLWAKSTLKAHARGVRRLYHSYNVDPTYRIYQT